MLNNKVQELYEIEGKRFVFTGALKMFTREQAMALVIERGGIAQTAIRSDTDYLIYGDKPGATKQNAARKHSVQLRSEQWLMAAILATTPGLEPRKTVPEIRTPFHRPAAVKDEGLVQPKTRRVRVQ